MVTYIANKMKNQLSRMVLPWNISNLIKILMIPEYIKLFQNYFNFKIVNEKKSLLRKNFNVKCKQN